MKNVKVIIIKRVIHLTIKPKELYIVNGYSVKSLMGLVHKEIWIPLHAWKLRQLVIFTRFTLKGRWTKWHVYLKLYLVGSLLFDVYIKKINLQETKAVKNRISEKSDESIKRKKLHNQIVPSGQRKQWIWTFCETKTFFEQKRRRGWMNKKGGE